MDEKKILLGIFAKEPLPGKVKTRLTPPLSATQAAELYRLSLKETVEALSGGSFSPVIFYAGDPEYFRTAFPQVPLVSQGPGDLGMRLSRALGALLGAGEGAALVGSDSPDLPATLVKEALSALSRAEVVTIPARDGGYVLIGERRHHPELFRQIPWSTAAVLSETRARAEACGLSYLEVGAWEDIDDRPSLERFLRRSPDSATARFAAPILAGAAEGRPVIRGEGGAAADRPGG
ncbi:hypothetical protein DSOUD_3568 [Desulfuromonas soudanensis]|uniref:Glycosyltransferase n=1 Tax=Desulfuromonas soudanensis TaxID=1603606 RepID=A0A0M4DLI5_9BACT|nr:TIGR04282 family arsenosugar biosynthesis glycosyltransferase [Desulfuromonas soudanensis]ALC18282.1 hypothetical protein DSOUD_3568 [Desulfuromonas soudanensis]